MKIVYKLRALPLILGLLYTFYHFAMFSGHRLPYQDPTPELLAIQYGQLAAAKQGMLCGAVIAAIGLGYFIFAKWKMNRNE